MVDRPHVYNRIFNEEDWLKVNVSNKDLIDDFKQTNEKYKKYFKTP